MLPAAKRPLPLVNPTTVGKTPSTQESTPAVCLHQGAAVAWIKRATNPEVFRELGCHTGPAGAPRSRLAAPIESDRSMSQSLRERLYRTNAIVLQSRDLGEADRVFVVYTPFHGKLSIIAKGARRAKSRLGPYLDYFSEVALHLTRGRDLDIVTSVTTVNQHPLLRESIDAYGHAAHFAELVRDLTQENQENHQVYALLGSSLVLLNDGMDPWPVARHFELGLLIALGYQPELFRCVNCERDLEPTPNVFSSQLGGMLCAACSSLDPGAPALSINAQKYLRTLARTGLGAVIGLEPSVSERGEISQTMFAYLRHVGDRDYSSLRVLGAMLDMSSGQRAKE
jgi:DNA repair protein RecO (recombination protein O)